jgi:hypothetical protein
MQVVSHLLGLAHGLTAAVASVAVFYLTGLLLLPRRWQDDMRWPGSVMLGLTSYVLLGWVATSSRHIPLAYVMAMSAVLVWGLIAVRLRWLQTAFKPALVNPDGLRWLIAFSIIYLFVYVLIRPPGGTALPILSSGGSLNLVTYARYARHLIAFGTADVELATFDYLHTPGSAHLLAWHSLFFGLDPLEAALPTLFMLAALFGMIGAELARSAFGLSMGGALAVAVLAVCAPMFRWALATYSLGALLAATAVLYLAGLVAAAIATRRTGGPWVAGLAIASAMLLLAAKGPIAAPGTIVHEIVEVGRYFSALALLGLPGRMPSANETSATLGSAAIVVLPFVLLLWAAAAFVFRRSSFLERIRMSPPDRQLARALIAYAAAAVIIGNVAVHAVSGPVSVRWTATWRQLDRLGRLPFRALTLKVADQPNGLSTMLAMYYMPGRRADVIGRDVAPDELPFDSVSREQPMFIHNFGCEGVGHDNTVSVQGVGCLLMAPPSITFGTSYPFNRTFLFLRFDGMTPREPGGRRNTRSTVSVRVTADPQRVRFDRDMYVNFLVDPLLQQGRQVQRLLLRWGNEHHGEIVVTEREWFSIPVRSGDWKGNRLWTMPIALDVLDRGKILFQELAVTESPRGRVAVSDARAASK